MESVDAVIDAIAASLEQSAVENVGLTWEMEDQLHAEPVLMDPKVQQIMEEEAAAAGITTRHILSGAGHDAMIMGAQYPVAMIFVPSKDGRSHTQEEWTDYEQVQKGVELLYRTVKRVSGAEA